MDNLISIEGLSFGYESDFKQFDGFNLEIPEGTIYGFLGPNGAGKSTLIRLILGLIKPTDGTIRLFGKILEKNKNQLLSRIGSLIEGPSLYGHLTAHSNLRIAQLYKGIDDELELKRILELIGLNHVKDKRVKSFSLGMKQRLGIGIALIGSPDLLILDEPINGLDPNGIIDVRNLLKRVNSETNTTIFISSHVLSEIELTCSNIAIINQGQLIFNGSIKQLKYLNSKNVTIEIETDNTLGLGRLLDSKCIEFQVIDSTLIKISGLDKKDIPKIISAINLNNISIYQVRINDDLEKLYLNLLNNENEDNPSK